ncbi:MAG: CoA-binding protein [Candidatus Helarchaeota archaeon]
MEQNNSLESLFFPRNITIVGASKNPNFGSGFFISALARSGFPRDKIYLINPKYAGTQIREMKVYDSVKSINDELDLVISAIKAKYVPDLLRDCVKLNVKYVLVFTSGFSELLDQDSIKLEKTLLEIIRGSNTRIIGPNCLGPLCPESKVTYNPKASMEIGNIGFASQSGGHATTLVEIQEIRGLYYNRGLSFGNQIDVNCLDVLNYYADNSEIDVIGMYLESTGSANGKDFFLKMKEVTPNKPVVIWKGGQTQAGTRAAASHTGAISSAFQIWKTAVTQAGGTFVTYSTEFWDVLHLFSCILPIQRFLRGNRVALLVPGGGNSVEMTDTFSNPSIAFQVPELSMKSQEKISELFPNVNTSFKNPIDTGASGIIPELMSKTLKILDDDENIDFIVMYLPINWISRAENLGAKGFCRSTARLFGRINRKLKKLFVFINPMLELSETDARVTIPFREILRKKNIPFFFTIKDAAIALRHLWNYETFINNT